jgi:malonyl CoA-acyl carrier protein transacylase
MKKQACSTPAMAAILKLEDEEVANMPASCRGQSSCRCNYNSPGQIVISGHNAVDRVLVIAG